jgi:hypothetical protein
MRSRHLILLMAALFLGGLGIGNASAQPDSASEGAGSAESSGGQSSARVYIDPKTGKLGGPPPGVTPPGLSTAVQQMLSRSDRGLVQSQLPNGAVVVNLQGRFQNVSVATIAPGGDAHIRCDHSVDHIEHALEHGVRGEK